ncbi:HAD-IA family hydrolase [Sphingomicrobium astaxanthinifaciens]|uniref:HAD-IA family hydrolase n=1 Tax=Sphingomicrobium astaxanthinifaciens TaxID=1227949 RepID=UPI001FCADB46|nr:HAD-IA family hydrolase [Sphingomicrobium astaxanthinifaciens]MCJ7420848.1 HAD-IA family hydrolase [Sphingomicrobium astaxanthinifaciens]
MSVKLAVFDCDGTLVDSGATIHDALDTALRHHGHRCPPRNEAQKVIGLSLVEAMQALVPEADHDALAATYKQAFVDLRASGAAAEDPYEGIAELLGAFEAAGWLLAVATGKSDRGLAHILEQHGWREHFISLQTADRHPSKPHPSMLLEAMRDAGAEPPHTVMIGDTGHDMRMARNAGVGAIGVAWGYHDAHELAGGGAHAIAAHAGEVLALSEGWRRHGFAAPAPCRDARP